MKNYEMLCVLPGTLTEEEVKSKALEVAQIFESYNVTDVSVEDMGKSRLAYPISHIRYGYFQLFRFAFEEGSLKKLEKSVSLLSGVLRVVVRKSDPSKAIEYKLAQDPTAPSAPQKEDRKEDRREKTSTKVAADAGQKETPNNTQTDTPVQTASADNKEDATVVVPEEQSVISPVNEEEPRSSEVSEAEVVTSTKVTKDEKKLSAEDLDKKLDEILQQDIDNV